MASKTLNSNSLDIESNVKRNSLENDNTNSKVKNTSFCTLLCNFLSIYWKSFIVVLWPIVLLPLIIFSNDKMYRCLYTIAVMAMFWVTEVIPLPITGLFPVFLYPLMGIMDTAHTCNCYMNDTTMMFLGSLVIAVAIEHSGLHMRVALIIIKTIGCSHRKLSLGLFFVTMFISMWISNTAATAMMIPIVEKVLTELEAQGLGKMFVKIEDSEDDCESQKKPTKLTMAYYFGAAYASSIGGIGTLVGTGTNLTMKGIYESRFTKSPGINFAAWMVYAVPVMVIMGGLTWLWLQIMYMGLFRSNSNDAKAIDIGDEGEKIATAVIENKYKELGPITWHESSIGFLFISIVLLWFFRKPDFIPGWPSYITDLAVKDSTSAAGLIILLFLLPEKLDFLHAFDKDPTKRPRKSSSGLIGWKIINQKMHWGLIFVLGGGFAIAAGSQSSGLSSMLGHALIGLKSMSPIWILFIVCVFAETGTELTSNVAVANIILPVLAEMSIAIQIHPLYLMVPATLGCSFSFHLPVGTPPNAIVSAAGKIKTKDFIIAGIGPSVITAIVTTASFATWGIYSFGLHEFPSWAT
ncbi:PREDICTED: protein I'm not dead yet-like [Ceratosolen solmsi marchali]|uniref:Protein I'm not dead yet-like n=1 Tax=Ceratosolen solmsi marchali TaxID=326594 RepID=A0AAJ6VLG9_9HYME|nr:PREDICTED: protein I'm not dead yet-like [Ceratosolen solmsi marchali]XP_011495213.1 PREDICTED: protein I'm not dead yet-like [Ceratosolen solmsi marchali]XP_011495214.1 PREDICTED: protein I'm not dead yet-like [Ceratosolen solmsi marchali]